MDYLSIFYNLQLFINFNFFLSIIIFFIFLFIYSMLSLPGLLIFVVCSGFFYGIFLSYFICILSITLGCFCFFILSKTFLRNLINKYTSKYSNKIDNFIKSSSLEYLIIIRMLPGLPLIFTNLLISFLNISYFKFLISTFIGLSPLILFSILIGNKINNVTSLENLNIKNIFTWDFILIVLLLIFVIFTRIIFKKIK